MNTQLLICKCGDCSHWEIVKTEDATKLKCVTCGTEYPAGITFDPHENLHFAEQK